MILGCKDCEVSLVAANQYLSTHRETWFVSMADGHSHPTGTEEGRIIHFQYSEGQ